MPVSVACQSCGRKLSVSEKHLGKKAKCPGCGEQTRLQVPVEEPAQSDDFEDDPYDSYGTSALPPLPKPKPKAVPEVSEPAVAAKSRKQLGISRPVLINVGVGLVSVVFGYFLGREHLKHQLASAFSQAAENFAAGIKSGFEQKAAPPNQAVGAPGERPAVIEQKAPPEPEPELADPLIPEMKIGEPYRNDVFEIVLQSAAIGPVPLKDSIRGGVGESENPQLMFKFSVKNVHERKILTFRGEATFGSQRFVLKDDVDNRIRGIDFGFSNKVVGELPQSEDIPPGEDRSHVQVFTVPPEKTQSLTLTVDCEAFGSEGTVKFVIPAAQIRGFNN